MYRFLVQKRKIHVFFLLTPQKKNFDPAQEYDRGEHVSDE